MAVGINKSDRRNTPPEGITDCPLSHTQLMELHSAVSGKFEQWWREGERNERRWMGDNWDESQRAKIRRQKRQAYSLAILASKLRYISATQKQLRTSYIIEPISDPNDEIKAQLATLQMRAVENRSNSKYVDSQTFESGLAIKYGVRRVGLDTSSVIPRIKSYSVDWKNFVWDLNSREYDIKKDSLWCAEVEKLPRIWLEGVYGKEVISDITGSAESASVFTGRSKISYFVNFQKDAGLAQPYDIISLFKHYHKAIRTFYYVVFPDTANFHNLNSPVVGKFKSENEANMRLRELNLPNLMNRLPYEGEVIEREEVRLDYYEFTYNKILYYEQTDLEMFPYDVYFAIRFEDKFASFQDFLNDPQLIIDRMWAQIDYSLGKDVKNVYQGNRNALDPSETPESAERKASQTGGIIWTKTSEEVFKAIQSQGANPQWINAIQTMTQYLDDMTGGRTFKGGSESANQSGIAIRNLQEAGGVMTSAFLDSFNQFKKAHGENILWWIREYESEEDTIKVQGGALSQEMIELLKQEDLFTPSKQNDGSGFVTLNKGGISYLKDAEVELVVREEGMTETMREKRYIQLVEAGKVDPLLNQSATYRKLKFEAMDLNHSDKEKITQELDAIQKQMMDIQQQQIQAEDKANQLKYGKDQLDQVEQVANIRKTNSESVTNLAQPV